MRDPQRIKTFSTEQCVPTLTAPALLSSEPASPEFICPEDRDAAQVHLLHWRHQVRGKKEPSKSFRAKIGVRREARIEELNTTFTLKERRDALEDLLQRKSDTAGLVQAVIDFHPDQVLDINVRDETAARGSRFGRTGASSSISAQWLQLATETNQKNCVRLLASRSPTQKSLDESLDIAIRQSSMHNVKELLRYGADPNTCHPEFYNRSTNGDIDWTTLLLRSRFHEIDQKERNKALLAAVKSADFDMVRLLLRFGANVNHVSGSPLVAAIQNSDFRMFVFLVSASPMLEEVSLRSAIDIACSSAVAEAPNRVETIDVLLSVGANTPSSSIARLLASNDVNLLTLLVKHQQVSAIDATAHMGRLPKDLSEDDALRISHLLFAAGADARPLGPLLYWAVQHDFDKMTDLLCHRGVSLDFKEAAAVQFAIRRQDTRLLKVLLKVDNTASGTSTATDTILVTVLPQAINISSKTKRHESVRLLLRKGIKGRQLDQSLLDVVTKASICDAVLVQMLVSGGASVNFYNGNRNCILYAAQDGNLAILNLLIGPERGASADILSQAVLKLYHSRTKSSDFIDTLTSLLHHGAICSGDLVAQTLVLAVQNDDDDKSAAVVELLLHYGANVNYNEAEPLTEALKLAHDSVLEGICGTGRINRDAFAKALPLAVQVSRANQSKLGVLVKSCQSFQDVVSDALLAEITDGPHGGQDEIVNLLLENGADVDHNQGAVFAKAIKIQPLSKSMAYVRLLLAKKPRQPALRTAFDAARKVECSSSHRYHLFKHILDANFEGDSINAALAETVISDRDNLAIPRLLLHHNADVNNDGGSVLVSAVESGNIQLVAMLAERKPNMETIDTAVKAACHANVPAARRLQLFESLLATKKTSEACMTYALTHTVTHGCKDESLLSLLSRHGPKIETKVLSTLISSQDVATTRFLLKSLPLRRTTRSHALKACLDLDRALRLAFAELFVVSDLEKTDWSVAVHRSIHDHDYELLNLMLKFSAGKQHELDEALVFATDTTNPITLRALLSRIPGHDACNQAFERVLRSERVQTSNEARLAIVALLEHDISQPLRDTALVQMLRFPPDDEPDFYQVLIRYQADVNIQSCICFNLAGQLHDFGTFNFLLRSKANFDLVIKSLVSYFPLNRYERLVELVFLTLKCPLYLSKKLEVAVLFEAMRRFGRGDGLMKLLLQYGYPAGKPLRCGDDHTLSTEAVTPLIWALGQTGSGVSDSVILELLNTGQLANPGFATDVSETTAVGLAARRRRHIVLDRLIELKADVSAVDSSGKSPLFYATANLDEISVYTLLENGAHPNDGSLQEAARLCQKGIILQLLGNDHDPNYSSDLHQGRTALGELCLQTQLQSGEQISAAYDIIKLLVNASTDLSFRVKGKTILHLAVENPQPVEITRVLLRFPEIYNDLRTHSEVFIYEDEQGRFMSPDVYVERYCRNADPLLIDILRKKGCKRKWFTKRGDQLPNCEGLPPALEEMQNRQDLADQEEQRAIKRREERAKVDLKIQQEQHEASMMQSKEQTDLALHNAQRTNDQQIAHEGRVALQRRTNANSERADERFHIQETNRIRYDATKAQNQLEYSSQQKLKQLEYSSQAQQQQQRYQAIEREAGLEKKMLESREAAELRNQARVMERLARQDKSVQLAAQQQRALIAAAKEARVNQEAAQLAIKWDQPD